MNQGMLKEDSTITGQLVPNVWLMSLLFHSPRVFHFHFHEETNATSSHHLFERRKFFQDFVAICSYSGSMLGIVAIFYVQLHVPWTSLLGGNRALNYPFLGGSNKKQRYGKFGGLPLNGALFRLVIWVFPRIMVPILIGFFRK